MTTRYRFEHAWTTPLEPDELFDVLADVEGYPRWWPQVRAVVRVDEETAHVVARSLLPYSLHLVLQRAVEDRAAGVLEARLGGQLDGWSRWHLTPEGAGSTRLVYEQEVTVRGRLLAAGSRMARPLLEANHAWMMRGGRRGLVSLGASPGGSSAR